MAPKVRIQVNWDEEAKVWVAESEDLPLVTEAESIPALLEKLPGMIQDLLDVEGNFAVELIEVPIEIVAHQSIQVRARAA